jgi:glycyl-tRNA synthetase beta chain
VKERSDFLLEVGCEEIPAGLLPGAIRDIQQILEKHFGELGLREGATIRAVGAPRRIAVMVEGLLLRQADSLKEILGPPKSVGFDKVGAPTRAAESFAQKQNVPLDQISIVTTPKGEYLAYKQKIVGRVTSEILTESLSQWIQELAFPRAMYWTSKTGPKFTRPIRWIVALLDGKVVPHSLADVFSGNATSGHRFLGKRSIPLHGVADYLSALRKNFVMADPAERRKRIESQLHSVPHARKLQVHADPGLVDLTSYLNEFPTVIMGDFDPSYLELPDEILLTVMRDHQKYFGVEDKAGNLTPHFLAVINLENDAKNLVRAGHEKVLAARFADARFFWETDQKHPLAEYLPKLALVTYESRLGTYGDKVERMRQIARWIAEQWFSSGYHQADVSGADRAAELAKCDLVTDMVREFTELQGIVGGLYAQVQGEPEAVASAVYDHYRPVGLDDPIPRSITGCIVSLADKIDSIVACYAIGAIPSGSSDPFALRRAALGVAKIIFELQLPLSLAQLVGAASKALEERAPKRKVDSEVEKSVIEFLLERAKYIFRERRGFAYDEVNAVFAAGADDLVDAAQRLSAVQAIRHTKDFEPLASAFKRIRKIVEKAGSNGPGMTGKLSAVRGELLEKGAEKDLHQAAIRVRDQATAEKRQGRYREALEAIAELRPSVDKYFDDVMVMVEGEDLRNNRLTMLGGLLKEFSTIADFSELVTADT